MRYTKEQRLDIGRRIYNGELTKYEAAKQSQAIQEEYSRICFLQSSTLTNRFNALSVI